MQRWLPILVLLALTMPWSAGRVGADCTFQLGFATLQQLIPSQVGACLADEGYNPANGDGLQQTSGGLLVWHQADNWTAFTDGYRTWINGPNGLVDRLNNERFPWEPDFGGDPRFGVILSSSAAGAVHALNALHSAWFIGDAPPSIAYSPSHVMLVSTVDIGTLTSLATQYPGRVWSLGLEPNGYALTDPEAQPAAYAQRLHALATTMHSVDPTAEILGPDILNWSAQCGGCGGMTTGQDWTAALRAAYLADYGAELPIDIWSIHTYPLDWLHLPTVDYQLMEQQLVEFRQYLDSIPAQQGKPIWDTELGVHWGYTDYTFQTIAGKSELVPSGQLRSDLVMAYFQQMLGWLEQNGASYGIDRWFVYSSYNPDVVGDHAGAISLLDGAGQDAQLTTFGTMYATAAGG
ncbi:MAG TPA: hypothetical protein VIU62_11750 [Chloroflexota bacterium]